VAVAPKGSNQQGLRRQVRNEKRASQLIEQPALGDGQKLLISHFTEKTKCSESRRGRTGLHSRTFRLIQVPSTACLPAHASDIPPINFRVIGAVGND
jgi:hypothetical protein